MKTTTSLWELEQKGNWRKRNCGHRLMHSITRRDEMWGGEGVKWEDSVGGGGAGGSFTPTYICAGWNGMTIHITPPGLLLTAIQIWGTAETRRCVADAVRLQVITPNAPLTLCSSYLPLPPPPSSSPCSHTCPLSPSSLIQHMVYRGVSTQLPLLKIIGILNLQLTFFALLFLRCFSPVHFSHTPCWKNAPLFSANCQSRKSFFPAFFFVTIFTPFKWICQLLISKNLKPPC